MQSDKFFVAQQITFSKELPKDVFIILEQLIFSLQKKFDISPTLLNDWINDDGFINWLHNKFEELVVTILGNLEEKSAIQTMREIYHKEQPLETLNKYLNWEPDKCGYLFQRYDNGYHKYCNQSRFDHRDSSHQFVHKTYQQMIEQKIFGLKYEYYHEFLEAVLDQVFLYFNQKINKEYDVYRVKLAKNNEKITQWIKSNQTVFKAKTGFINKSDEYLDIYVPKSLEFTPTGIENKDFWKLKEQTSEHF